MKVINIGFSSPSRFKIGAELIKLWTRSSYSHAYIRFENESLGISTVYQASHGMVHFKEYSNFLKDNKALKEYKVYLQDDEYKKLLIKAVSLAGEPYSFWGLVRLTWYDILNYLGYKTDIIDSNGYFCAELVGKFCTEVLEIKFKKPNYLLTPENIQKEMEILYGSIG